MKRITIAAALAAAFLAFAPVASAQVTISNLPSATTPLAGTEVSPVVQSSTTKKVPVSEYVNQATIPFTGLSFNKVTITAPATGATVTIADGKTLTASNSGTLAGGDAFVLAIAAAKTLTVDKSIEFDGTDSTKMTFPSTNATVARTDAAQSFTGTQTFSGQIVTATGLPTIANGACGAGANGAVAAGSTNQSGQITIGASATTTCTVDFSATLGAAPKACYIQPANATAAAVGTTIAYVSEITTAHFVVTGSALASANYGYTCL